MARITRHRGDVSPGLFAVCAIVQQIIAGSDDFEYPVRPDTAPNGALPPLARIGHTSLSVASLGTSLPPA